MKPRIIKRTLSLITVLALIFTLAAQGVSAIGSIDINKYPYVYVHGLFGWGEDEGIDDTLPYWGSAACSLMDELNKLHYESYAASVGPMSSNWDRVCELYAQITGTRVDYGKALSEKFNHSRYGRTYTKPMIEGWGEPDADGNIKKINLVGHSFGGATVRTLTALLAYGSEEEQAATSPDDTSPQFTGGKCSMDYVHKIFTMFPNCKLRPSYGSTEVCASCSAVLSREEVERRPELCKTVGRINANCEMKLVDNDGKEVPVGEVGEGLVRSPAVFRGYIKNEELNARVLRDGWFHTEDLLRRDEEGFYYLVDRKKDMIKTGGENVYAQEVEDVLRNHPSIFDCALIGVDDDRFGEAVAAAIVLNPGCTLSDEELIAYCRANLPSYKKPRYVAFVDELPHNVTGKIQKSVLRENADKLFRPVRGL